MRQSIISDEVECPEGYRRYVYQVKVSVPFKERFRAEQPPQELDQLGRDISQALGVRVSLKRRSGRLQLVVHFSNEAQLQSFRNRLIGGTKRSRTDASFRKHFRIEQPPQDLDQVTNDISQALGVRVSIKRRLGGLQLVVHFDDERQIESFRKRIASN